MAGEAEAQSQTKKKQTKPWERKQRVPPAGRSAGGPACFGCRHYGFALNHQAGACAITGRTVQATSRHPCGVYQIWHAARLEAQP